MELDKLTLIAGDPIVVNDWIQIKQPTLNDIKKIGESEYYNVLWTLCSSPWDMPSMLDDIGIDFMSISEWDFFRMLLPMVTNVDLSVIFGDLNFAEFQEMQMTEENGDKSIVLFRAKDQKIFDEETYHMFIKCLRELIGFQHKGKKAANKATAEIIIMDDRKKRQQQEKDKKEYESIIYDMIVSLVNTEEFSYDYKTVMDITLYQLMKSFTQIQGKKSAVALMQGSMSGFVDTSGINPTDMTWTYSEDKYKPKGKKLINNKIKQK